MSYLSIALYQVMWDLPLSYLITFEIIMLEDSLEEENPLDTTSQIPLLLQRRLCRMPFVAVGDVLYAG